ncbi:type II toxin-antitoxin system ParD family antitoxin [Thalassospira sp.]|uniref:ribbon-helix-helix domain-containing protein n=1 Tax=Thalassospira sp. TaxID=1912094 RepID=UPI000C6BC308|nr:type II toxin-antitoxin system ParD family antitoxin [Thalassospira sp.]MBC04691.1 type II toxin-antitoxin system ParD family antitoxin [Thalassospira sp.]|tara:strand:+ start:23474 stop:23743 length:270 start_codon:yes stop_codon:yes gene_type:complete
MTVKSSISLTDSQNAFARELVAQGKYPSVSAVLQQGLELLRNKSETESLETEALRQIITARRKGEFVSSTEMKDRISAIAAKRRASHDL